jgi:hypothetical protein
VQPAFPASALGTRYQPHIADVCALLAREAARHPLIAALLVLVWFRLRRILARLDRLAARWQQGRLRARARPGPTPRVHPAAARRPHQTPRGHAWLIRLHQPLAQLAPRIELLLADPEIAALCAAAPQAARLLRPLCQMFGLTTPAHIRPAPRPPRPKPAAPPPPPPWREHTAQNWPFVPQRLRQKIPRLKRRRLADE